MKICVFASTNGTDLEAVLGEMQQGKLKGIDLKFVLVNKADCGAAEKAKAAGVPLIFLDAYSRPDIPRSIKSTTPSLPVRQAGLSGEGLDKISRRQYDSYIASVCEAYEVDLIVLVGWMRLFSADFVKRFERKIINIHPSLLPKYPGMDTDVHRAVLDSGDTETGMTIHYVDEGMDTGEIILQKKCPVDANDTVETLKTKVQALEKEWYPEVLRKLAKNFL
jgi:phosphoribosylglycinamide formyltransferase 1